jgi:hypothetical protein
VGAEAGNFLGILDAVDHIGIRDAYRAVIAARESREIAEEATRSLIAVELGLASSLTGA